MRHLSQRPPSASAASRQARELPLASLRRLRSDVRISGQQLSVSSSSACTWILRYSTCRLAARRARVGRVYELTFSAASRRAPRIKIGPNRQRDQVSRSNNEPTGVSHIHISGGRSDDLPNGSLCGRTWRSLAAKCTRTGGHHGRQSANKRRSCVPPRATVLQHGVAGRVTVYLCPRKSRPMCTY
jgi:hypothetical protein